MEFARKQLEKYGWTDGKGLGKKEDGISEALKPKLKRSITGVGYDAAKDFTEHWWSELYNKAASNVQVEDNEGKTKRIKQKDDNFEITNNTFLLKGKTKSKNTNLNEEYKDFFVRTEVIENDRAKIVKVEVSESSDDSDGAVQITDEQLYAACEGRTAHKGARHGLRALGKLARIEQQEQILLQEARFKGYSHVKKKIETNDSQIVEDTLLNSDQEQDMLKLKKKKKKRCSSLNGSIKNESNTSVEENENVASVEKEMIKKSKKRKREKLNNDDVKIYSVDANDINDNDNNVNSEIELTNNTKSTKKKKRKTQDIDTKRKEDEISSEEICASDVKIKQKNKKKKTQ